VAVPVIDLSAERRVVDQVGPECHEISASFDTSR
jgi:hypothetical protein